MEKYKIPKTRFLVWMERISAVLLAFMIGYTIFAWLKLPEQIPTHWGLTGKIDGWGSRDSIWFSTIMATGLYILLTVIFHHPSIWNTGTTVTEENKEWVYQKLAHMLVILRLIIQLVFFCILYQTVRAKNLGLWGSLLLYTSPFLPLLWYFYLLHKKRKGSVGI